MHVNQYCPDLLKKKKTKNREEGDTDDRETMTRWKMSSMEKKSMCIFVNCSINYLVWLYKYVKRVLYIILLYKNGFLLNLGLFHEVAVNKNAEVRVLSSSELLKIVWEVEWPIKHILLRFTFPVWIWHFCLIKTLYWHVLVSWHLQLTFPFCILDLPCWTIFLLPEVHCVELYLVEIAWWQIIFCLFTSFIWNIFTFPSF